VDPWKENIRVQRWVLLVGILLFFIKMAAWYLTNSVAILTDALESTVNVLSAGLGLYSLWLAAHPRDKNHPHGHGKIEFLSAAIEGTLIMAAGALIIWESTDRLFRPQAVQRLDLGIILVASAGGINALLGWLAMRTGIRNRSLALESSGRHLLSDAWSTAGLLVGLFLVFYTGYLWLDAAVAMLFGLIILVTGYRIIRRSVAGIMDEADEALLREMIARLQSIRRANWVDVHKLRIIKYGSVLHIDCHLTVPWFFNVKEAHAEVEALEEAVRQRYGNRVELFVHTDGCRPTACAICAKESCPRRQSPFREQIVWTLENSIPEDRHQG
jgi:cation diffusion facilitator family transporter